MSESYYSSSSSDRSMYESEDYFSEEEYLSPEESNYPSDEDEDNSQDEFYNSISEEDVNLGPWDHYTYYKFLKS